MFKQLCLLSACMVMGACGQSVEEPSATPEAPEPAAPEMVSESAGPAPAPVSLDDILSALPEDDQARIPYRHPKETLTFFGVEPGMTVVDTTPGGVWYTGILADYLGPDGQVIGADRPLAVWESFGSQYATAEFLAERENWPAEWSAEQTAAYGEGAPSFNAIIYGSAPEDLHGTVDVVMMIREFHNMKGADGSDVLVAGVLEEIYALLKPGGVFGIVQHRAPEGASDEWATGRNGYVKQSEVVRLVEAAGFALEETSEVNANPNDQPTEEDYVWRLPPTLSVPEDDQERRAAMLAIGESDRMTLKFRK
ncbi:MAG: methyltransferase [Pseudomonadota bacterium]